MSDSNIPPIQETAPPRSRSPSPPPAPPPPDVSIDAIAHLQRHNESLRAEIGRLHDLLEAKHENSITEQLWLWVKDCKMRRTAYWKLYYRYQKYNNIISTPLTLIASATGITSIAQLGYESSAIQIAVAVLGTLSTAFTAYQRYFNWGQKAVQSREIAKRYTLLARKGELQANLYKTQRITLEGLVEFMEEFRKELDGIQQETEDMPTELLNRKFTADPNMSSEDLRIAAMYDSEDEFVDTNKVTDHEMSMRKPSPRPPVRVNSRDVMFSKAINM